MHASVIALWIAVFVFFSCSPSRVSAQPAPGGVLHVTVVDASGAVIVGATVTVTGVDDATKATTPTPVPTSQQGVATIPRLIPGRYAVEAAFPGFETRRIPDVRVRNGDNRQVMLLPIEGVKDSVVVQQSRQEGAADPRGPSFGTTLTREQLEALSDDPEVLRQQLQDMAGPGAVIKVDSFEGGALPPKAQIRSIRISRDQFAAENHSAGGTQIEIITQPGMGPLRFNAGLRMRGNGLGGRSPFTPTRGPERNRNYFFGGGGTLIKNKSSFNLFVVGSDTYETPNINVALGGRTRSEPLAIRSPRDNVNVNGQVDYALTLDQTLRLGVIINRFDNRNLGIGAFDEEDRAYSTRSQTNTMRLQHMGPLGRRAFTRTRLQVLWSDSDSASVVEAPTIRVNDAFNRGGAQIAGGQHARSLGIGSDLDYVRGIHTVRSGLQIDASRLRSDDTSNYLGTYTFESLDAFLAGRPRSFTQRLGDPNIRYQNLQGALYLQDDARVRRNLTLSAGLRYEAQTHVEDFDNLAPRFGVTWAPFAAGQTTLRSSWGIFYDWLPTNTYEQTLRVNGFQQQELNIIDPTYPDFFGVDGTVPPINRYFLGDDLLLPRSNRLSLGIDQRLMNRVQSSATYSYTRITGVARGLNVNAPIDGVRPVPSFGNVVEVASDARSLRHQLQLNLTANPGALLPAFNALRIGWKRVTVFLNYTLATLDTNADGAFNIPPSGRLDDEWGPASGDVRHRFNGTINNQIIRNLLVSFSLAANSGTPYTIRTGRDENGDLVFNDRPAGVGRNTERTAAQWQIFTLLAYAIPIGRINTGLPPGVTVIAGGGVPTVQSFAQPPRYVVQFFLQAQNLTNHPNYAGYSGTMTSPFFGQPTMVNGTRKVDAGINISF
jgi:carboxypeptidase family protein